MSTNELANTSAATIALLRFLAEAGVDEAIGEAPVDRTQQAAPRPAPASPTPAAAAGPIQAPAARPTVASAALVSANIAATAAAQAAAACDSIAALRDAVAAFDGCALKVTATNTVFARGNPAAPVMFIGEAPGREEDALGQPFVGESGRLLDRMLKAIGRDETGYYITNIIYWRPPGNRDPSPEEIVSCRPFTERHIALAKPKVLVLVGKFAAHTLLGTAQGITRLRGSWHEFRLGDLVIPAMPMLHPAYLLRQPGQKREAWRDMLALAAKLEELGA